MSEFVAINRIYCHDDYRERFEQLFATRAHAIDRMPGFLGMQVLRPHRDGEPYLVVSIWESEEAFRAWTGSPEFLEGHRRGFEDLRRARDQGKDAPMRSEFVTYDIIAR